MKGNEFLKSYELSTDAPTFFLEKRRWIAREIVWMASMVGVKFEQLSQRCVVHFSRASFFSSDTLKTTHDLCVPFIRCPFGLVWYGTKYRYFCCCCRCCSEFITGCNTMKFTMSLVSLIERSTHLVQCNQQHSVIFDLENCERENERERANEDKT